MKTYQDEREKETRRFQEVMKKYLAELNKIYRGKKVYCWNCKFPTLSVQCDKGQKEWMDRNDIKPKPGEWYMLNEDNNCISYKCKWWKFWI